MSWLNQNRIPEVSIIVPVFNTAGYLKKCLDSVIRQDIEKEIIIVNDGSTDESDLIIAEYAKKHPEILVVNKKNGGLSSARNAGLAAATGDYVSFVDSDDWVEEQAISKLVKTAKIECLDIIAFDAILYYEYTGMCPKKRNTCLDEKVLSGEEFFNQSIQCNSLSVPVCFHIFRRKLLIDHDIRFIEGIYHEDWQFTPRAYFMAERIKYTNKYFYYYRKGISSITSHTTQKHIEDLMYVAEDLKKIPLNRIVKDPGFLVSHVIEIYFHIIYLSLNNKALRKHVTCLFRKNGVSEYIFSNAAACKSFRAKLKIGMLRCGIRVYCFIISSLIRLRQEKVKAKPRSILYIGYNSFMVHKRGVENVIDFQSGAFSFRKTYYLHWGNTSRVYKAGQFINISIRHDCLWPLRLNLILKHLHKKNILIVHSHNPLMSFFSIYKTDIFTVHDGLFYQNLRKKVNRIKLTLFWLIEHFLYSKCKITHFVSEYSKMQSLISEKNKSIIIPNTSHFENLAYNTLSLHGSKQQKSVLIVRSIEERARLDLVIQTAACMSDYFFMVAGKGPLLDFYRSQVKSMNVSNIEFLGYVSDSDLLRLYSECDLVMVPAEHGEGFGLPIIEGYLFNKPVIASNRCAIPEVIISKDYLFENSLHSIVDKFKYVAGIDDMNYSEHYRLNFSNSIILEQFRNLYLKMSRC